MDLHQPPANTSSAADSLRLVLSLLEQHDIPPTPCNYALWFEYVAGDNTALKTDIDQRIAANTRFTDEIQQDLIERHLDGQFTDAPTRAANVRIAEILSDLLCDLAELGEEATRYDAKLQEHLDRLKTPGGMQNLEALLLVLAEETKQMRRSTQTLRTDFARRSGESAPVAAELQQVKRAANSAPLTGLPNRRALLEAMTDQASQGDNRYSLLMLDIDNFKAINDEHGHLFGDRVIRFVADVIPQNTKGQDTPSRFGGEEFAVLLPDTQMAGALTVAEKIRHVIASAKLVRSTNQQPLGQITLSGGVATYRKGEDSLELMERADQALYLAKERGRNKIVPETEL